MRKPVVTGGSVDKGGHNRRFQFSERPPPPRPIKTVQGQKPGENDKPQDEPVRWRDMTPEEKGALLLAAYEGKDIQFFFAGQWGDERPPMWFDDHAYRVRPEPKRETVTLWAHYEGKDAPVGRIDLIDGNPDPASIKIEELP